jgi:RNA polymerase sigma factor (sigma-70 family)
MSALGVPQQQLARTEADLVGAVRSGDESAFAELYSRYGGPILGYVGGILGDQGRAEDVTQDVFVSAFRAMRSSDRAIAFKPWIYEIARNACIDDFRRRQRSREVSADGDQAVADRRDHVAAAPSPHAQLERRQQLDNLRGAFSGLTNKQHKVLMLRELEGCSYEQIAQKTGMSIPKVESTLFRARRRLGYEYDEIASGRRCEQVHHVIDNGGEEALRALGLRERRRFARHISHCQPCRRQVRLAGIDDSALRIPSLAEKLAGLLPLPLAPWRRIFGGSRAARAMRSVYRAAQFSDPGGAASAGQTAVVVVVAAMAVGGGIADRVAAAHAGAVSSPGSAQLGASHPNSSMPPPRTPALAAKGPAAHPSAKATSLPFSAGSNGIRRATSSSKTGSRTPTNGLNPPIISSPGITVPQPSPQQVLPLVHHLVSPTNHVVKSTKKKLSSLLHKTNSVTKKLTHKLGHLPGSLTGLVPKL